MASISVVFELIRRLRIAYLVAVLAPVRRGKHDLASSHPNCACSINQYRVSY